GAGGAEVEALEEDPPALVHGLGVVAPLPVGGLDGVQVPAGGEGGARHGGRFPGYFHDAAAAQASPRRQWSLWGGGPETGTGPGRAGGAGGSGDRGEISREREVQGGGKGAGRARPKGGRGGGRTEGGLIGRRPRGVWGRPKAPHAKKKPPPVLWAGGAY